MAVVLEDAGFHADCCEDAAAALQWLQKHEPPDLITFDLVMPRMDGWEFRVAQRSNPAWAAIPVIALSADRSAKAAAIDADAHLTKPVDKERLVETARRLVAQADQQSADVRAREMWRLSSLGVLAAGLAHELNNPLAVVLGFSEVVRRSLATLEGAEPDARRTQIAKMQASIDRIDEAAQRVSSIVQQIGNFAKSDRIETVNVTDVLDGSLRLVANQIRQRAQLHRSYRGDVHALCSPAKLGQLSLMLLTRAVHAIDEGAPERNSITVEVTDGPDQTLRIRVSDTGVGVAPELIRHVFEPRNTRARSQTVDLALVQELAREMGGSLDVTSAETLGTTFTLTLPAVALAPSAPQLDEQPLMESARRARVLVIDDEPAMCDLLRETLQDAYEVETETDPKQALDRLLNSAAYDLVLCDLMMPKITGMDLHTQLQAQRPQQAKRMLFMTGGTFSDRARIFMEQLPTCLRKPFDSKTVRAAIAQHLREHDSSANQR